MIVIDDCIVQIGKPDENNNFKFLGTGFAIHGFVITAGHVPLHLSMIRTNEDELWLEPGRWHKEQSGDYVDFSKADFAFYEFEDVKSILQLAKNDAIEGDILEINCFIPDDYGVPKRVLCQCEVKEDISPLYTRIVPNHRINHGASGCPVYKDGIVYGILTGGSELSKHPREYWLDCGFKPEEIDRFSADDCWMLKASYILNKISI